MYSTVREPLKKIYKLCCSLIGQHGKLVYTPLLMLSVSPLLAPHHYLLPPSSVFEKLFLS